MTKPFTPESLAKRWDVSATTVRNMCLRNELVHFRLGHLYRIPATAVEEVEQCKSTSDVSVADTVSIGMRSRPENVSDINLRHAPERRPRAKVGTDI
ncbi:helix-turn-helix domain-containing protein [Neptunicoccus cionae]|uniref:helix-turn-helix domain-containing protein n=1 Tax=Neptunicoccus cionae TaxID=2035344 RepID=UPI00357112D5